ncbi:TIGR01777 family oxidoreductase [Halioxenophilus sp. WMMB6]|uniref:TIGR01777 family oxidoreductase n=1 Tax=Halioxenophilus sp. WMMB6 TaxID=3073815 RepID=UPI00295F5A8D|nr:TIGR01777 family oxidoreductase [Halioxenophilus sp. WMMB6]
MHLFVTGGSGLIGSHLIASRPQDQITVLTRQRELKLNHPNYQLLHNLDHIPNLDFADAVVNLAGEPLVGRRWTAATRTALWDSRVGTTARLVELMRAGGSPPASFLSGSAIGIYGDTGNSQVSEEQLLEEDPTDFAQQLCFAWEQTALQSAELTRVVLLRTSVVLAQSGGALAKMLPMFRLGLGGRLGSGRQHFSWIHIQDLVAILNWLLDSSHCRGPVNLVAPNPVTNNQFTAALARACHRPALLPVPAWLLRLVLGQASQLLLDSQAVLPRVLLQYHFHFSFPELDAALADLLND